MARYIREPKKLKGAFRCSRINSSMEEDFVNFELIDEASRLVVCDIKMSIEQFGELLSVSRDISCEFNLFETARIGMQCEYKTEVIPRPEIGLSEEKLQKYIKSWEKDGWVANIQDLKNPHLWVGQDKVKVGFNRWIEKKNSE